jgi:nitronate monooxygenase
VSIARLFGIEHPIIQAPMAGMQAGALAAAVCEAGALGSLPCALLTIEGMVKELELIRARTSKPYNVNFFCHVPPPPDARREQAWRAELAAEYREFGIDPASIPAGPGRAPFTGAAADALEPFRPAVVSFHFGLPDAALVARVKGWGSQVIGCATTVEEAQWLEARGVDAVVAQGVEAGGHRGNFLTTDLTTQLGTFALLPQVKRAVRVPVIAAGGIVDGHTAAAAFALGAGGVQVGTAFLLCPEATTSAVHRMALKSPAARHTALTNVFTGRPARGIVNRVMREHGPISDRAPEFPLAVAAIAPLRAKAEAQGSGDFSPLWSGQNASACREVPAAEVVRELAMGLPRA